MISKILIGMVRWYQKYISPAIGPHCKYQPTCSQYMIDAVTKYGPIKGTAMGIWRILRCNPFSKGGYDPVRLFSERQFNGEFYFSVGSNGV